MPPRIEIAPEDLATVREILHRHIPDREVWAFGSRVSGTCKRFADLDLAIIGDSLLPLEVQAALAEEFDESGLSFKVDLVDWAATTASFREIIRRQYVVVQRAGEEAGLPRS